MRSAIKFLFRIYVSFSNPAYVGWRQQLRIALGKILKPSDKLFLLLMVVAAVLILLEIIEFLVWTLNSVSFKPFNTRVFVYWLLSMCSFVAAGWTWCNGFLKHLIRIEIFRVSLYRSYAWALYVIGAICNLAIFLGE